MTDADADMFFRRVKQAVGDSEQVGLARTDPCAHCYLIAGIKALRKSSFLP